jgi:hypothetical protein
MRTVLTASEATLPQELTNEAGSLSATMMALGELLGELSTGIGGPREPNSETQKTSDPSGAYLPVHGDAVLVESKGTRSDTPTGFNMMSTGTGRELLAICCQPPQCH